MRIVTTTVFTFDELDDKAKEKARDWYRTGALDYEWWDCIYEDAKNVAALMGIKIDRIGFSGFASQGDGAHVEGHYSYLKGAAKAVAEYVPKDATLARIARELQDIQRRHFYRLEARVKHRGHYQHSYCTDITVGYSGDEYRDIGDAEEDIKAALRSFMDWVYRQLEKEYDYLMADEQVDESIRANGYEFEENGSRA